jgi:hypothetical protein
VQDKSQFDQSDVLIRIDPQARQDSLNFIKAQTGCGGVNLQPDPTD